MHLEILQREYGFAKKENSNSIFISTPRVETCVVWYGVDVKNGIGFLCHFDFPFTARAIPSILKELQSITPKEHLFKCQLLGGRKLSWSPWIRKNIHSELSKQKVINLSTEDGPYFKGFRGKGFSIDLNEGSYKIFTGKVQSRNSLKETMNHNFHICTFSPMRKAIGSI